MKKIISLSLVFCICILSLISCAKIENDPVAMAQTLDEAGHYVEMYIDSEDIEDFADDFEITAQCVYCIIETEDDDDNGGYFIFCESKKSAKAIEADCNELVDDEDVEDITVYRKGKVVFVGSEDILNKVK